MKTVLKLVFRERGLRRFCFAIATRKIPSSCPRNHYQTSGGKSMGLNRPFPATVLWLRKEIDGFLRSVCFWSFYFYELGFRSLGQPELDQGVPGCMGAEAQCPVAQSLFWGGCFEKCAEVPLQLPRTERLKATALDWGPKKSGGEPASTALGPQNSVGMGMHLFFCGCL
jgi:hypothetical protein